MCLRFFRSARFLLLSKFRDPALFERTILRHLAEPPLIRGNVQWLRRELLKLPHLQLSHGWQVQYENEAGETRVAEIPHVDFKEAVRTLYASKLYSWAVDTEWERHFDAEIYPRSSNWVPDLLSSRLLGRSSCPRVRYRFGRLRGHKFGGGRKPAWQVDCAAWLIFFDAAQLYRQKMSADTSTLQIYMVDACLPSWFRKLDAPWIRAAGLPGGWVKRVGIQTALAELFNRLFEIDQNGSRAEL